MNKDNITVKNIIDTIKNKIKADKIIFKSIKNITITIRKIIATMNNIYESKDLIIFKFFFNIEVFFRVFKIYYCRLGI